MIDARGVSVDRGLRRVLHELSVQVRDGEVLAVVGPNGAGKSTLLAALAGDLPIRSGQVLVHEHRLDSLSASAIARLRAVLPQTPTLAFDYLVHEVVALGRLPFDEASVEREAQVRAALHAVDMHRAAERPYLTLSGGERQRVHLARALAQAAGADGLAPLAVLFDEPLGNLDPAQQVGVLQVVRRVADRGAAVLIVLHDLTWAARLADRVLVLRDGHPLACAPPREALEAVVLEAAFDVPFDCDWAHGGGSVLLPRTGFTPQRA
ncbi:MAG: heme ABC transporter ATP-binding protein [Gemmatimonadaceae bacterium]|nr:heme ABC transporter ATP-binding protein [Gemmatimonadaceae bacterium]